MDYAFILKAIEANDYHEPFPQDMPPQYPPNHVFNDKKTVAWNRQQVILSNDLRIQMQVEYRERQAQKSALFRRDITHFIMDETGLNEKQAGLVFQRAYEAGHHNGELEVLQKADDLVSFLKDLKAARGEEGEDHV